MTRIDLPYLEVHPTCWARRHRQMSLLHSPNDSPRRWLGTMTLQARHRLSSWRSCMTRCLRLHHLHQTSSPCLCLSCPCLWDHVCLSVYQVFSCPYLCLSYPCPYLYRSFLCPSCHCDHISTQSKSKSFLLHLRDNFLAVLSSPFTVDNNLRI